MEEKQNCGSSQSVEYLSVVKFTWKIANFSKLSAQKLYSDFFNAGGYKWRILTYPKGTNNKEFLSVFLEVSESAALADGWSKDVKFSISVVSTKANEPTVKKESKNSTFDTKHKSWGYSSFMLLNKLEDSINGYLLNDVLTVIVEVSCAEDEKQITDTDAENSLCPFSDFDSLYTSIQNILEENSCGSENSNSLGASEVAYAEAMFDQCLDMDIANVIQLGLGPEFKNALYILLTTKAFPINMVDRTSKIVSEFIKNCSDYEIAQQDLSEAQENENSVSELKANLKQLLAVFAPIRSQAEAVDKEIARLEKQTASKRAQRELLGKKIKLFTAEASASKEELICAEEKKKVSTVKRKSAEEIIKEFEQSWTFLKDLRMARV